MSDKLELPKVGELTLPQWQDWLVKYNEVLGERERRIDQLEKGFVDILSQQPLDLPVAIIAKACLVGAIDKNGKYCFVGDLKIVDGKPLMEKKDE